MKNRLLLLLVVLDVVVVKEEETVLGAGAVLGVVAVAVLGVGAKEPQMQQ